MFQAGVSVSQLSLGKLVLHSLLWPPFPSLGTKQPGDADACCRLLNGGMPQSCLQAFPLNSNPQNAPTALYQIAWECLECLEQHFGSLPVKTPNSVWDTMVTLVSLPTQCQAAQGQGSTRTITSAKVLGELELGQSLSCLFPACAEPCGCDHECPRARVARVILHDSAWQRQGSDL